MKTKKITKILTMGLITCSLLALSPTTNVFADASNGISDFNTYESQEDREKDLAFLETCNKTTLPNPERNSGTIDAYEKNGKYYISGRLGTNVVLSRNCITAGDYYAKSDGSCARNEWVYVKSSELGDGWRYYGDDCRNLTGVQTINNKQYLFRTNGRLQVGWGYWNRKDSPDGEPGWFYTQTDGTIKGGWIQSSGNWYYIQPNGRMAKNTTIDGYKLNSKGIWVK